MCARIRVDAEHVKLALCHQLKCAGGGLIAAQLIYSDEYWEKEI